MKTLFVFIASLIISNKSFGQSIFGSYTGTIKSYFTTNVELSGKAIGNPKVPMDVATTKAVKEKTRELSVLKDGTLKCKISKIVERIDVNGKVSTYDSDNTFERDQVASALATNYDDKINKSFAMPQSQSSNYPADFEYAWVKHIPITHPNIQFTGILIKIPPVQKVGSVWADTIQYGKTMYFYTFKIERYEGSEMIVATEITKSNVSRNAQGNYSGTIKLQPKTGFIYEMNLKGNNSEKNQQMDVLMELKDIFEISIKNQR